MRRIVSLMLSCSFVLLSLASCGSKTTTSGFTAKASTLEGDYASIIAEHSEFSDLSIASFDDSSGSYTIQIDEDNKRIGFFFIGADDDGNINAILICWSATDIVGRQYKKLMSSAFMLGDNRLSYDDAYELADEMNDILIFGGDAVEKNGITYNCSVGEINNQELAICAIADSENIDRTTTDD